MTIEKKFTEILRKSEAQTMRHYAIQMKEDMNFVGGVSEFPLDESQLSTAMIIHKKGASDFIFGKINGTFFNYFDGKKTKIDSIQAVIDLSDTMTPEAYIALFQTSGKAPEIIKLSNHSIITLEERCIVYWETEQYAQLTLYGYDHQTKSMQCSIQSVPIYLAKRFLRLAVWNMLPKEIIDKLYTIDMQEEHQND